MSVLGNVVQSVLDVGGCCTSANYDIAFGIVF